MSKIVFKTTLLLVFILCSCSVKKNTIVENYMPTDCPKEGDCTIEIIDNTSMVIGENEDGTKTLKLEPDPKHTFVRFEFQKNTDQSEQDGSYKELVVFEIEKDESIQKFENQGLQKTKMLFGRFCFCRGRAGLFKVNKGKLEVTISKQQKISFTLEYELDNDSKLTNRISVVDGKLL